MEIREASAADGDRLTALQARCPQGTSFVVTIVNVPDFFSRARTYANCRVYVATDGDDVLGSAACAVREATVDGRIEPVGYVFQACVAPESRRQGIASELLRKREEYLRDQGAVLAYTVIMEGNVPSMRYVERQGYRLRSRLLVPGLHVFREMAVPIEDRIRPAVAADLDRVAKLVNDTWRDHTLYEPLSAKSLAESFDRRPGLGLDNLLVVEDRGEIAACIGYWEWARVMEITVRALSARMKLVSLLFDAVRAFRPMPASLKPGSRLRQIILTSIGFRDPAYLAPLVRCVNNRALERDADLVYAVCESHHPLLDNVEGFFRDDTAVNLYVKPFRYGLRLDGPFFVDGLDL